MKIKMLVNMACTERGTISIGDILQVGVNTDEGEALRFISAEFAEPLEDVEPTKVAKPAKKGKGK